MRKIHTYDWPCVKSRVTWNMCTQPVLPFLSFSWPARGLLRVKKNITVILLFHNQNRGVERKCKWTRLMDRGAQTGAPYRQHPRALSSFRRFIRGREGGPLNLRWSFGVSEFSGRTRALLPCKLALRQAWNGALWAPGCSACPRHGICRARTVDGGREPHCGCASAPKPTNLLGWGCWRSPGVFWLNLTAATVSFPVPLGSEILWVPIFASILA